MVNKERETFTVTEEEFGEMLWGKEWKVVQEDEEDRDKDMVWTTFVFERLSDGKFFSGLAVMCEQGGFEFDNREKTQEIEQVFKKTITKTIESWG